MFEPNLVNLGIVQAGTQHKVSFFFKSDEPVDPKYFSASCGCSVPSYNSETQQVEVTVNMGTVPMEEKNVVISYRPEKGVPVHAVIKAKIVE